MEMQPPPELSLIICTYRRPRQVAQLLVSLSRQIRMPDETLVIDASPDLSTRTVVEEAQSSTQLPKLTYCLAPPEQRGLTRQRNLGVMNSTGNIIAFLDDDVIPSPDYFLEILSCFERNPDAVGVGGCITNQVRWTKVTEDSGGLATFRIGDWERRDDIRWRVRRLFGLGSPLPPGHMPQSGHGRPSVYPPDGADHNVEFVIGCSFAFRRRIFDTNRFSNHFEGYGLYEDLDFCIRARRHGSILVCTKAKVKHFHAPSGRPNQFRYGIMVVRNGWYVWRKRWPRPILKDRCKWWMISALLTVCRLGNTLAGPRRIQALTEVGGRVCGMLSVLIKPPRENLHDKIVPEQTIMMDQPV